MKFYVQPLLLRKQCELVRKSFTMLPAVGHCWTVPEDDRLAALAEQHCDTFRRVRWAAVLAAPPSQRGALAGLEAEGLWAAIHILFKPH